MTYIKGLLALQMLLVLLLHLAPGERYGRYLRHFAELVLVIGLVAPVCEWIYGSDRFMEQIAYETFAQSLEEFSRDMEKVSYGQSERFREEYEQAMGKEIRVTAEEAARKHGLGISEVSVGLSEDYQVDEIRLVVTDEADETITVGKVVLGGSRGESEKEQETNGRCALLAAELADFYGVEESRILLEYYGTR